MSLPTIDDTLAALQVERDDLRARLAAAEKRAHQADQELIRVRDTYGAALQYAHHRVDVAERAQERALAEAPSKALAAEAQLSALREALRRYPEWIDGRCYACGNWEPGPNGAPFAILSYSKKDGYNSRIPKPEEVGHAPSCPRQAALALCGPEREE